MHSPEPPLGAKAHRLLELAGEIAGADFGPEEAALDPASLDTRLASAGDLLGGIALRGRVEERGADAGGPSRAAVAGVLGTEIALARNSLSTAEMGRHHEALNGVDEALKRLRSARSVEELAARIPREVVSLGYTRALFSWVDQMHWIAHSAHSLNGPDESRNLVEAGNRRPFQNLKELFERDAVTRRRAILRKDVLNSNRVHPELIKITRSHSYVAAPLVTGRGVEALVHLDADANGDPVTELDRAVVSLFCEGASYALERAQALEDMAALQAGIERNAASLRELIEQLGHISSPPRSMAGQGPRERPEILPQRDEWDAATLTRREAQVLRLLASGLTNGQIGERLYITEGTAKTHVKNVLHKLGASNRTEAAALYRERRGRGTA